MVAGFGVRRSRRLSRGVPGRDSADVARSAVDRAAASPIRWRRWQILAAGLIVALGALVTGYLIAALPAQIENTDFLVYRGAVGSMLSGGSLYDFTLANVSSEHLEFTYPPFAGLALAPIGLLPPASGLLLWSILQLACCVLLAIVVCRGTVRPTAAPESWLVPALATVGLLFSEPVHHGIAVGQVSLVLVFLVVVDSLLPSRWRGLLTGVAGAVKLIPLVFLPYYVITGQWRAARNLGIGFVGATVLAFAILPGDSLRYWGSLLFETGRVGEPSVRRNKSLLGLLAHTGLDGSALTVVWLVLAALVTVLALRKAAQYHRIGDELGAVLVVGVLSTLVSPISWPHHLVWASLAAVRLVLSVGRWSRIAGLALWLALVVGTPLMGFDPAAPAWLMVPESLLTLALAAVAILGVGTAAAPAPDGPRPMPAQPTVQ